MKGRIAVSALSLAIAQTTWADAPRTSQDAALPVIKVTGTRTSDISSEALTRRQATSMRDIFALEPSVDVGGGATNARRLYLNGIEATNLNISIDGARQGRNLFQHRGNLTGLDPALLKRVEIDTAAGQQGPGALGGSVRFETLDAQDLLDAPGAGARVRLGYGSADRSEQGGLTAYARAGEHLGFLAHVSAANRDDYRTGSGTRVSRSASDDRDYLIKLSLLDLEGHDVRFSANRHDSSGIYARGSHGSDAGYLPDPPPTSGPSVPRQQKTVRESYALNHRYRHDSPWIDWRASAYLNDHTLSYPADPIQPLDTREHGAALSNTFTAELGTVYATTTLGGDYFEEKGTTRQLMRPEVGLTGDSLSTRSENLGLYVQQQLEWGPVGLSAGYRLDDYQSEFGPIELSGTRGSPNARVDYDLTEQWSLFAGYREASRAAGTIPIGWLGRLHGETEQLGGPLREERSRQKEAGVAYQQVSAITPGDLLTASVTYFETDLSGLIEIPGSGGMPAAWIRNADTITVEGWRASLQWQLDRISTQLGLQHRSVERNGEALGIVRRGAADSGDQVMWDTRWQATPEWQLGYTLNAVSRLKDVPQGQPQRPGYAVHGAQLAYQPQAVAGLEVNLAIHNLLDKQYADQTSLYSSLTGVVEEPGRDIRLSATYAF